VRLDVARRQADSRGRSEIFLWRSLAPLFLVILIALTPGLARAQGPDTSAIDGARKLFLIAQMLGDIAQGKATPPAVFEQAKQEARNLVGAQGSEFFFFDFGDPNLPLNQFAATVASNLLALAPLYALAYLVLLVWNIWRERPIPNPLLYIGLVIGVMFFLAAFAVITRGMTQLGRALAFALAGQSTNADLLDLIIKLLDNIQRDKSWLALPALFVALIEFLVIVIQLLYRGITLFIWRLIGLVLIPLSILLEGVQPKTAGRVLGGFFEAWLDIVGKIALLVIVITLAGAASFSGWSYLLLPTGLLVVIFSWNFIGIGYKMLRDTVAGQWSRLAPAESDAGVPLSSSAEQARARTVDEERKRMQDEG
jgi:hypothetical protein